MQQQSYSHEELLPRADSARTDAGHSSKLDHDLLPLDRSNDMDMDTDTDTDSEANGHHKRKVTPDRTQRHGREPPKQTIDHDNQSEPRTSTESSPAKRARRNPSVRCPICHEVVAPGQYQQHYRMELAQIESSSSHERYQGQRYFLLLDPYDYQSYPCALTHQILPSFLVLLVPEGSEGRPLQPQSSSQKENRGRRAPTLINAT